VLATKGPAAEHIEIVRRPVIQASSTKGARVHKHRACIMRNRKESMGRSRRGLISKIHAVVDSKGLPVWLAMWLRVNQSAT
jgi:hypothetical protein